MCVCVSNAAVTRQWGCWSAERNPRRTCLENCSATPATWETYATAPWERAHTGHFCMTHVHSFQRAQKTCISFCALPRSTSSLLSREECNQETKAGWKSHSENIICTCFIISLLFFLLLATAGLCYIISGSFAFSSRFSSLFLLREAFSKLSSSTSRTVNDGNHQFLLVGENCVWLFRGRSVWNYTWRRSVFGVRAVHEMRTVKAITGREKMAYVNRGIFNDSFVLQACVLRCHMGKCCCWIDPVWPHTPISVCQSICTKEPPLWARASSCPSRHTAQSPLPLLQPH